MKQAQYNELRLGIIGNWLKLIREQAAMEIVGEPEALFCLL
ncbi:protein of unknown function [Pseudodesulfovibrio profundus]|uniref:Uncharacterized protein n=1 Tax=Pseudodesulfovibrio profundus TaxID=57320 RepID=A0A2C8FE67_9BACT|nr:protein of unknown function [Pseudodesulfovibrio profundus]